MQISEYHGLDNDSRAPFVGKMHLMAVDPRLFGMPGGENVKDGVLQLLIGVIQNSDAPFYHGLFIGKGEQLHLFRGELKFLRNRIAVFVTDHDFVENISFQPLEHPPGLQESPV